MAITALELQEGSLARPRHLRVVRRSPRPGGALAAASRGADADALDASSSGLAVMPGLARSARRGVAGAAAAIVLLLGALMGVATAPTPSADGVDLAGSQRTVVVGAGESAWDVAAAEAPGAVDDYTSALLALNGLESAGVPEGTVLQLPED